MVPRAWVVCAAVLAPLFAPTAAGATPPIPIIQSPLALSQLPSFVGAPATPRGFYAPDPPSNPFMAANGLGELHDDAYQSDTYQRSGPLGRDMSVISTQVNADCASVTFDRQGRLLTVCVGVAGPTLYMFDPATLATMATMALPARTLGAGSTNIFQDFTGGGYFYLDNLDRVVIPTTTRHVLVIAETATAGFSLVHDYDVSAHLGAGDKLTSALPDWDGRIVFESFNGVVGTIDPAGGAVHTLDLGEETENSFAVDETGAIFVVSNKAMYRLELQGDGTPVVSWREVYPNSGIHKPGQVDAGSGTTPTVQGPYVTITDNADPLDIVVYRRARTVSGNRRVCVAPVFAKGAGADENSIIGAGDTMIVENNFGYSGPAATTNGGLTSPGLARVDINPDASGCHVVWTNDTERVPTAVSKVSLAAGLLYTYTKDPSSLDPWYFTALDFHTGRLVYKRLAGTGLGFNNNYAPVTLGPDGSAYVGVIGGLVALRDATPPDVALTLAPGLPSRAGHRPVLALHVRRVAHRRLRVYLTGPTSTVRRATYTLAGRRRRAGRRPFTVTFSLRALKRRRHYRLKASVRLRAGGTVRLSRRISG